MLLRHLAPALAGTLLAGLISVNSTQTKPPTVLFICEHGSVKSLLAKTLFEQYAKDAGLTMTAESRGTHADSVVPPWMITNLATDGLSIGGFKPRQLAEADLIGASMVVSFDVPAEATAAAKSPRAQWDGLPSVTQNYAVGRDAIKARVRQLVDSLKRAARRP